jgi:hypothetical protein
MKGVVVFCVVLFWNAIPAPAQGTAPPDTGARVASTARITVQADVDSAIVLVDSVRMGQTPLTIDLKPGFHRLKIIHPDVTNWLTGSIPDSILVGPGEQKTLRYAFGHSILLLSVPSGADVYTGDSLRGSTPLLLAIGDTTALPTITLKKADYDSTTVTLSDARRGIKTVALRKSWTADREGEELDEAEIDQKHSTLRIYLAGAVTVAFGAAAAYYKIQADNQDVQYLGDFNPSSHSQVRRNDTAAAVCLTVAEVGFGFLTYFLLTE